MSGNNMRLGNARLVGIVFAIVGLIPLSIGIVFLIMMNSILALAITGGIGLVFVILGLSMVLASHIKEQKIEKIKSEGMALEAIIIDVEKSYYVKVNNRHPYILYAQYKDVFDDKTYDFKSSFLMMKPRREPGETVRVYVMRDDYDTYYMDTADLY